MPPREWAMAKAQFAIIFEGRFKWAQQTGLYTEILIVSPRSKISAGLLEQASRIPLGFFLLFLFSARGRPFHHAIDG